MILLGLTLWITDVPLHNPWEGIVFLKDSLEESVQQIFPVSQNVPQPLTPTQVNHIIMTALSSSTTRARIQSIEQVLLTKGSSTQ